MIIRKHIIAVLVFALLSTVLIISWFRYGYLYGGGDVGIPSYDSPRIVEIAKYIWWEAGAPGNLVPHGVTSLPVQFFQSALVGLGLPYFAVQATVFWIILFLMGYGMFRVGLSVFGRDKFFLSILCGLFYLLNPYMMIQVWHRFIHNSFFLAAFLPFFYIFWDNWIKSGRFTSIFYFLVFNFFGVYLYGSIAYIATVLFVLFFIFLKNVFIPLASFSLLKTLGIRFIVGIALWVLIHAWWMMPTFSIVPALVSSQHGIGESIATLTTLSKQTIIPYTLPGINPFYLFDQADFGSIYKSPVFLTILWIPLIFLIPGLVISIKSKILAPFGLLFISAVFLAKGAAAPFGFLFVFGISQVFALGVLRNPNEKLGILLPFSLAIIYTVGIKWYLEKFQGKHFRLIIIFLTSLLFLQMGVYLWPFWAGKLIGNADKLALVDVPAYYNQADDFIKLQNRDGRILHLPLPQGESVTYNWLYPFSGIESSQLLFSSLPSVSRGLNIKHVDDMISAASNIFREDVADEKIIAILKNLNVRFIVLHKDINWQGGFLDNPSKLEKILDSKRFLEKKQKFGDLIIYEIFGEYFQPKIYIPSAVNYLSTSGQSSFWPYLLSQNSGDFLSALDNSQVQLEQMSSQNILLPVKVWTYHPEKISFEKAVGELPAASNILPGSPAYFLIQLKESLHIFTSLGPDKMKLKLNYAGKRLREAERLKEKGKNSPVIDIINSYQKLISDIVYTDNLKDQIDSIGGRAYIDELFSKHLVILDDLSSKGGEQEKGVIQKAESELISGLKTSGIRPYSTIDNQESADLEYNVYHFDVPTNDQYELLMADLKTRNIYSDRLEKLQFQIDGKKDIRDGKEDNGFISYGEIKLDSGKREVVLAATPSANLYKSTYNEIKLSSTSKDSSFFETQIDPATAGAWYTIQFDAWIQKGEKFKLQLIQDSDPSFEFNKTYTRDDYNNFWNHYRVGIFLDHPASSYTALRLLVEPWDECQIENHKEFCSNKLYIPRKESSTVLFRNIQIQRLLNNPIFLRSENKVVLDSTGGQINFIQRNPVFYSGKIKLEKPGFVIFSEAFHNGWRLKLQNGKESFIPEKKFLANLYANAWYVQKTGEYDFELEFIPQRKLDMGIRISGAFFVLVTFYLIWLKKR